MGPGVAQGKPLSRSTGTPVLMSSSALDLGACSKLYHVDMALTVSKLASRVGVTADAIRYYERIGLLAAPPRSSGGYRMYDEDTIQRLQFIKGAQRLGLRLGEIRELLTIRDQGLCPCGHADEKLQGRIVELDQEIARLTGLRSELTRLMEERPSRNGGQCIERLFQLEGVRT